MRTTIADVFYIFIKWRKFIILNFFIFCFFTAIYSLTVSKTYRSNAVLLTPLGSEDQFSISSFINNLPFAGLGGGQASGQLNLYLAILNSRQIIEDVAKRFNLQKIYNAENMEATVRILQDNFSASINDDGSLTVSVAASTPFLADQAEENEARELCSEITNYFVQKLDEKYKSLRNEQARNNRLFIEKRYHQNLTDLQRAEDELKQFQKTQGVLLLPEQAEAALQAAADLYAKITTKEIEIAVLENYVSSSHNGLIRSKTELNELEAKFSQMKSGYVEETAEKDGQSDINLFVPLNELPEIAVSYFRLYREVTLQEKLLEFLLPQYEQMKIQEAKDTPTVQVLDYAVPPIKRSSPKRTVMVLFSGFLSFLVSFFLIYIFEYWQRVKDQGGEEYKKLSSAFSLLKPDKKA